MADGNITVTLTDLRGDEERERNLWAERGRWLMEKLTERSTPDGRTVLELVEETIWAKEDGTFADYCAAVDGAMQADSDWWTREQTEICQPDGLKFDAFGEPRTRYVRVTLNGSHCIMCPSEGDLYLKDARAAGDESEYIVRDVWLSEREFDDLPEHDGF